MEPNELAELYDSLMVVKEVLANRISEGNDEDQSSSGPYMSLWIQALTHRVSGNGWNGSPSYGEQQYRRNGISINEYREEYGNGTRVTNFEAIDTAPPTEDEGDWLDIPTPSDVQTPVLPDSQEKLPLVVQTDEELIEALTLIGQLPNYPETGGSTEPAKNEAPYPITAIESDQRVEELVVRVDQKKRASGSKKDDILQVVDVDENSSWFTLWSKHGISSNWRVNHWYWLHNSRVKVWDSSGEKKRKLSSTRDLIVEDLGTEVDREHVDTLRQKYDVHSRERSANSSSARNIHSSDSWDGNPESPGDRTDRKETTVEDDVVTDIMEDLDFD